MIGPKLKKKGLLAIRQWPKENNKLDTISFFFNDGPSHIDVNVYRKIKKNNKQMWWGDKQKTRYKRHANGVFLPGSYFVKLRWVKFYDKKFKAPCKPELYLEQKYGKNWKKLDFKNHNYFLRKNKYV